MFRYLLPVLLLLIACSTESSSSSSQTAQSSTNPSDLVLVFLAEEKIEFWQDTAQQKTIVFSDNKNWQIGKYRVDAEHFLVPTFKHRLLQPIELPESLHSSFSPEMQVYVFPNDARGKQQFQSCLRCPHQTSELYSFLKLELDQFK